jgi:CMP-N-acetylneuraminic acid synthetase
VPRKNVLDFCGKPMLAWTVEAALESGLFGRVVVSTEDAEIAETALRFGAEVDRRAPALATDTATVRQVCLDFLDRQEAAGLRPDRFCCLYATAALRTAEDIRAVMGLLNPGVCDFACAVTTFDLPVNQALHDRGDGVFEPMWPEIFDLNAKDWEAVCVDNGSTYAMTVAGFRAHGFMGPGLRTHLMPRWRSVDIDEPEDLELARLYGRRLYGAGGAQ